MKSLIILLISSSIALGFATCKPVEKITFGGKTVKNIVKLKVDKNFVQPVSNPAFAIDELTIEGDIARLVINYSGGCKPHKFKAFFTGNYSKSLPPQANIYLLHENGADKCRQVVADTLYINVKPLRYEKSKPGSVVIGFNNTVNTIEYKHN